MAAEFPCPHCGARYPVKPVLVGRPVRCTECKEVFKLREDGTAEAVGSPARVQPPATPRSSAPTATTEDPAARTRRLGRKHEELRRSMAATLTDAASKALEAESVRRESTRLARKDDTDSDRQGSVGKISPAVLTDYGTAEARNRRRWLYGSLAGLLILALLVLSMVITGDRRAALQRFAEPDPDWTPTDRMRSQRDRAWLADPALPIILNIDEADFVTERRIDLAPLRELFTQPGAGLHGYRLLPGIGLWVPADAYRAVQRTLRERADDQSPADALAAAEITAYDSTDLRAGLERRGMSPRDIELLCFLLDGQTDYDGGNWIRERFAEGYVPDALEIALFQDDDGRRLRRVDTTRFTSDADIRYRGRLMRFVPWTGTEDGKDLSQWHLLDVQLAGRDGGFAAVRGY